MILYTEGSSVMKLTVFSLIKFDLCVDLRCVYCVYIIYAYIFLFANEDYCNFL